MNTQQTSSAISSNRAYWAQVVTLGLIVGLGLQFAQAWTPPPGAPPAGNVGAPLTTSADSQTKGGRLILLQDLSVGTNAIVGTASMGRWAFNPTGAYFGHKDLNQTVNGNYAIMQSTQNNNTYVNAAPGGSVIFRADGAAVDMAKVTKDGFCLGTSGCKKSWDEVSGIPAGAVMAFNLNSCPSGWSAYGASAGRNIVGIDPGNIAYDALGERGGRDSVTLSSTQIPASDHYHNMIYNAKVRSDGWGGANIYLVDESNQGGDTEYDLGGSPSAPNVGRTSTALVPSPRTPVPVMDPYVVLRYCVKS
jgi:microcystin-dependent protein